MRLMNLRPPLPGTNKARKTMLPGLGNSSTRARYHCYPALVIMGYNMFVSINNLNNIYL